MAAPLSFYPIGTIGQPWGDKERAAWREQTQIQRSYKEEVLDKLESFREQFAVEKYGALSYDVDRYPLFYVKTCDWEVEKPTVLVTGGVHGYETSGVQGAILFLQTEALNYSKYFNIIVIPCVSPWGYETIQRWNANAVDPNRSFYPGSPAEECENVVQLLKSLSVPNGFTMHIDLHETTDTDESEFRPAKAARDGEPFDEGIIPDGFYLVGQTENPQADWHTAIINSVRKVSAYLYTSQLILCIYMWIGYPHRSPRRQWKHHWRSCFTGRGYKVCCFCIYDDVAHASLWCVSVSYGC
jgi:hypothetical protein